MSKKNILMFLHTIAFLLVENLCANRIIWFYDISSIEDVLLFLFLVTNIVFDMVFLYLKFPKREPLTGSERKKLIIESVIAGQFLLILLVTFLSGTSELRLIWIVLLAQILILADRLAIHFVVQMWQKDGYKPSKKQAFQENVDNTGDGSMC